MDERTFTLKPGSEGNPVPQHLRKPLLQSCSPCSPLSSPPPSDASPHFFLLWGVLLLPFGADAELIVQPERIALSAADRVHGVLVTRIDPDGRAHDVTQGGAVFFIESRSAARRLSWSW
jgi:hypothetical protein